MAEADSEACEKALAAFWRNPTHQNACAYLKALLPVLRSLRKTEGTDLAVPLAGAGHIEPVQVGPYTATEWLGEGAESTVYKDADHKVAVKVNARGDAVLHQVIPSTEWPAQLLRTYAASPCFWPRTWIARELADETLHEEVSRVGHLPLEQVLDVFKVACRGVAWLHERHVYGWSAHSKNVYRVGTAWKLGDFGGCWCFLPSDDPLVEAMAEGEMGPRHFGKWAASGILAYDSEREHRLALDDCSMLGGLLVQMLTGRRWEWVFRAVNKQPYCSAHYPLTGDRISDHRLSVIVNRAWRGEAGGAPLLANDGRGEQSVYDSPLELLDDVSSSLVSRSP